MIRAGLLFVVLLICVPAAYAACDQASVQAQINAASNGAMVTITPANCSASWNGVSISGKYITLDGNGANIERVDGSGQALTIAVNSAGLTRVKNFDWSEATDSGFSPESIIMVTACTYSAGSPNASFRIDHSTFVSNGVAHVFVNCHGRGLMDHDTFNWSGNNEVIHVWGDSSGGWTDVVTPGSVNAVYVEDSIFHNSQSPNSGGGKFAAFYGARTVSRFNEQYMATNDQHGTAGAVGARWWESYKNFLNMAPGDSAPAFHQMRAGSGMIFDNTLVSGGSGWLTLWEEDSGYPALYQVGRGQSQNLTPAYIWLKPAAQTLSIQGPGTITANKDFYIQGASFNGTTGVGVGARASRPATCTASAFGAATGVAYWATDQGGNWDTLNGGANDGCLDVCTATNTWTGCFYTPLTYPHPLQASIPSCSNTDINAAIAAAQDGDTVNVPAGNCTWTGAVSTSNKRITLAGAGSGASGTVITASDTNRLNIPNNVGQTVTVRDMRMLGVAGINGFIKISGTVSDFRITGMYFQWTSDGEAPDGLIYIQGTAKGLIDHNTFAPTSSATFRSAIHIESDGVVAAYARPSILGTANAVFIEDNTFTVPTYSGSTHGVWAQTGGSYVFRHNTLTNWGIDMHGPCSWYGGREFEIYENDWIASGSNIFAVAVLRGGTGVVYNNRITTNGNSVGNHRIRMQEVDDGTFCTSVNGGSCYACNYFWNYQLGRGTNNALDPIYFWNNRKDGAVITTTVQGGNSCPCHGANDINHYAQQSRDWYDSASTPKPGYSAYVYPHPLQGIGSVPSAPTNFRIVAE